MTKILSIGEVMLELSDIGNGLYKKSFAGDTSNFAYYINVTSGGSIVVDYLTAIGYDMNSDDCLKFLVKSGISISRCLRSTEHTIGLFILSNDAKGEKQYGYWRGQSAARHIFDQIQDLSGYNIVYFSGITAAITKNKNNLIKSILLIKNQDVEIVFDFNFRKQLWSPDDAIKFATRILQHISIIKISDEEFDILYPTQNIESLSKEYPNAEWLLTCSRNKAEIWKNGNIIFTYQFEPIDDIVDSSAAGDAFIATYLTAKLAGTKPQECLHKAHVIASQVVCAKGSIIPIDMLKLELNHA